MGIDLKEREFLQNLNLLKFLALILVILGHSTNQYRGNWVFTANQLSNVYKWIAIYVNSMHMQIFVFISGSIYAYCRIKKKYYLNYGSLVKDKLERLIIPYILTGILFMIPIGIKVGISAYEGGFINSIKNLILGYSAGYLWFLMMLFMLFLIYYWFEKILIRNGIKISIIILFLLQIISEGLTKVFLINRAVYYMSFFYFGYIAYIHLEKLINMKSKIYKYRYIIISSIFIAIPLFLIMKNKLPYIIVITKILYNVIDNIIAILGIIQIYTIVVFIKESSIYPIIQTKINYINKYNFNIYLLHEPIIFLILSNILDLKPTLVVLICFLSGIFIPIVISEIFYLTIYKMRVYDIKQDKEMIKSFQGLRVIGMMCIFFFHLSFMKEGNLAIVYNIFFYEGYFAVTFFLILSGLVAYRSLDKKKLPNNLKTSINNTKEKFKKMYLVHIITFIFIFISIFRYINNMKSIILSIPNIFLLQSFIPLKSIYLGFNGVSWYISTLMFCYFMSNCFYNKIKTIKQNKLINIVIIIYSLQLIIVFIGKDTALHHWLFYINPVFRSIDFFIGMVISRILLEGRKYKMHINNYTFVEIILILAFIIIYSLARYVPQAFRWGVYYTPIIIMIIIIFGKEKGHISKFLGNDFFVKLSTISFEFYMIHQIVIIKLSKYFVESQIVGIIMMFIISIIVSISIKLILNCIGYKVKKYIEIKKINIPLKN